jgi:putative nucleotidyltransferase with HDIG domain
VISSLPLRPLSADRLLVIYATGLVGTAVILLGALAATGNVFHRSESLWLLAVLALIAVLADRQGVQLTEAVGMSVAFLPLLFAAVVLGPFAAALIGALTVALDFGRPYLRWTIWTASRMLIGGLAGLSAAVVLTLPMQQGLRIVLATGVAAVVDFALDFVFTSTTLTIRGTGGPRSLGRTTAPVAAAGIPVYTAIVGLLAYAYVALTPWAVVLFFVPAFAAQRLFVMYREQQHAMGDLAAANARLERANLSFAGALVATLDARDRYTAGHSAAVAVYARDIAARMGLSEDDQQLAHLCGLVHDIGKIGLPAGLLEKPGPLTLDERRQMELHSEIGARILAKVEDYADVALVVRHHHERVDGNGYPDRLTGQQIPVMAKIIAVADAYNAMTSDRPYRDAMPSRVARLRLAQAVESQFDTSVVAAFEAILAGATEDYRSGNRADFILAAQDAYASLRSVAVGAA